MTMKLHTWMESALLKLRTVTCGIYTLQCKSPVYTFSGMGLKSSGQVVHTPVQASAICQMKPVNLQLSKEKGKSLKSLEAY